MLMERVESDFTSRVTESLTTVKKVNKTDAATLLNTFKVRDYVKDQRTQHTSTLCLSLWLPDYGGCLNGLKGRAHSLSWLGTTKGTYL